MFNNSFFFLPHYTITINLAHLNEDVGGGGGKKKNEDGWLNLYWAQGVDPKFDDVIATQLSVSFMVFISCA